MQENTGYPERLRVLSLFAGIGGIDLGLERAGMQVVAHAEIDPYACRVLAKHWPDVPNLGSVVDADFAAWEGLVDVIAGGFPCQDISLAGKGAGIKEGTRSGLWSEYARAIREIRPRYVIVENVSALLARGIDRVLGDLAAIGFDAWWDCLPAAAVGAPHRRDRLFVVATRADVAPFDTNTAPMQWAQVERSEPYRDPALARANADREGRCEQPAVERGGDAAPDPRSVEHEGDRDAEQWTRAEGVHGRPAGQWSVEPGVGRVAPRIPHRVDRLRCLGNAVVPQVAQYIGELVVAHRESQRIEAVA